MKPFGEMCDEHGNFRLDESYTEILKLDKMLTEAGVPHTIDRLLDGWQVIYPNKESQVADAIQHFGSYGNAENLLEIMGLVLPEETDDCVLGYLTAEDVFKRMHKHYTPTQPRKAVRNEKVGNKSKNEYPR